MISHSVPAQTRGQHRRTAYRPPSQTVWVETQSDLDAATDTIRDLQAEAEQARADLVAHLAGVEQQRTDATRMLLRTVEDLRAELARERELRGLSDALFAHQAVEIQDARAERDRAVSSASDAYLDAQQSRADLQQARVIVRHQHSQLEGVTARDIPPPWPTDPHLAP